MKRGNVKGCIQSFNFGYSLSFCFDRQPAASPQPFQITLYFL